MQANTASHNVPDIRAARKFLVWAIATVAIIYALILVGGVVRATGAGMGCPDWPTCFGRWVPPTSEAQLPVNYQLLYADRGYANTTFNVRKTWTEYLNRLLGVFTGFAILLTLLFSLAYRRYDNAVVHLALAGFILVAVQGWLGSRVVASNLHPGLITLHMLLAQVIVGLIIAAIIRSTRNQLRAIDVQRLPANVYPLIVLAMLLGLAQLLLGTQVREAIDLIAAKSDYVNRHLWIENLPAFFAIHKYVALPLLLLNGYLVFQTLSNVKSGILVFLNTLLIAFMVGTIVMGMSMDRLNLPMFAQPLHLFLSSLIFGTQLAIFLVVRYARSTQHSSQYPNRQTLPE